MARELKVEPARGCDAWSLPDGWMLRQAASRQSTLEIFRPACTLGCRSAWAGAGRGGGLAEENAGHRVTCHLGRPYPSSRLQHGSSRCPYGVRPVARQVLPTNVKRTVRIIYFRRLFATLGREAEFTVSSERWKIATCVKGWSRDMRQSELGHQGKGRRWAWSWDLVTGPPQKLTIDPSRPPSSRRVQYSGTLHVFLTSGKHSAETTGPQRLTHAPWLAPSGLSLLSSSVSRNAKY